MPGEGLRGADWAGSLKSKKKPVMGRPEGRLFQAQQLCADGSVVGKRRAFVELRLDCGKDSAAEAEARGRQGSSPKGVTTALLKQWRFSPQGRAKL